MTKPLSYHPPIIHLDMDGVLADLDAGVRDLLGVEVESTSRSAFFKSILPEYTAKGGFEHQGKHEGADELVDICMRLHRDHGHSLAILTSGGQFYLPQSEVVFQKKKWIEREFPQLAKVPFTVTSSGADKAQFAHPRAYLIDDHAPNIEKFCAASGWGITYTPAVLDRLEGAIYRALRDRGEERIDAL